MRQGRAEMTLGEYFGGADVSRALFDAVSAEVDSLGPCEVRVTKSQVAFGRARAFAWTWMPDRYLGPGHAPLVLSIALRRRDGSPRWKQVVESSPGLFMHHLELYCEQDIDGEVANWLGEAAGEAGVT